MYITNEYCEEFNHLHRFAKEAHYKFLETLKEAMDYCDTYGFEKYLESLDESKKDYNGNEIKTINELISITQLWNEFIFTDGWGRFVTELEENLNNVRKSHNLEIKNIF